jgi:hypothetical protein
MASAAAAPQRRRVRRVRPRVHTGELMSAAGALVLAPIMFALEWYGVVGVPQVRRSGIVSVESAWDGLTYVRWLMLASIVVALGAVVLHATQRGHGARTDTGLPVAVIGTVTALAVGYRILIDLPSPRDVVDVKLGGFLGLLAVLAIAVGGWESVRQERARRRGATPAPPAPAALASEASER